TPGRHYPQPALRVPFDGLQPEGLEPLLDLVGADLRSEHRGDARRTDPDPRLRTWLRVSIDDSFREAAAGELQDELRAAVESHRRGLLVSATLEAVRGFRMQPVAARRAPRAARIEDGALDEDARRSLPYFARLSAHHARERGAPRSGGRRGDRDRTRAAGARAPAAPGSSRRRRC